MTLAGTRILVTGAASGLGAALSDAFAVEGAEVLRTDLAPDPETGRLRLDITSEADWASAAEHVRRTWGGLDVLVNNAGVAGGGRIELCDLDEWRWLIEVNLLGVVRGTRAFLPMLKERPGGRIVNVASLAGLVHPAGMGSYNAVKAAVVAFTETTGHELASSGGTAHAVCPSYFRTNLTESLRSADPAVGGVMRRLVEDSPISAGDIAVAVLEGLAAGHELIVPDDAARAAWQLKTTDRTAYDQLMRAQARKLEERA
jgi:NAD(P)-dependent dehydrogenase (short-subunit alcohol dehydrogenase family)